ncbi:peptidase [Streptomyces sp. BE303]|uniref:peptidase n=1 Tax=Streptomyces sp. BE303 TaxID=3002528 RepID=UPI002E7A74AE|nr:peptidase [Streptomyces sp. BE303]MED7949742.1 peptidase [Streptomyces sp. BE303]
MPPRHRLVRLLATPALAAVLLPLSIAPATAVPAAGGGSPALVTTLLPREVSAGWLARQLVDGDHFERVVAGTVRPDQDLTVDAVLAFAAAATADDAGARATAWLARPDILADYLGDGTTEAYAGPTAKLLLLAQVRGLDPTNFGGVDLVARLLSLLAPNGRFADRSQSGDRSDVASQSFALIALSRTAAGIPQSARGFLSAGQCPTGGYPAAFGPTTCTGDPDATALGIQGFNAGNGAGSSGYAMGWLVNQQRPDGGFVSPGATEPNAVTTGRASHTLFTVGSSGGYRAFKWLEPRQLRCAAAPEQRGAVPYNSTGFDQATAVRATVQATLAFSPGLKGFARLSAAGAKPESPVLSC